MIISFSAMEIHISHKLHLKSPKNVGLWPIFSLFFFYCPVTVQAASGTADTAFNFGSFSPDMPEITVEGDAYITEPIIDLTLDFMYLNSGNGSVGRATYSEPVRLWDKDSGLLADFITHFSFVINSHGNSTKGNGFAFFLSPNGSHLPPSSGGPYLGLNSSANVRDNYVAVEFDTAKSLPWDPANAQEHIGIDLNSLYSVVTWPWTFNDIANGGMINASVRYNSSSKNLSVFVTNGDYRSPTSLYWYSLYKIVDLRDLLPEWVTLGFTASTTRSFFERHQIHSWNFVSSLENPKTIANQTTPDPNQISPPTNQSNSSQTNQTGSPPTSPDTDQIDVPINTQPPRLPGKKKSKVPKGVIVSVIGIVAFVLILGFLCYYCYVKKRRKIEGLPKSEKSSERSPLKSSQPSRDEGLDEKSILQSPGRENKRNPTEEAFEKQSSLTGIRCENSSVRADVEGSEENSIKSSVISPGNNSLPTEEGSKVIRPRSPRDENNSSEGIEEKSIAQTLAHESSNSPEDEGFEKGISSETNSKSESNHLTRENNSRPAEEGSEEKYSPRSFSYRELVTATKDFTHLLGEGGFGRVYKGVVPYGNSQIDVAVKKMAPDPDMVHSGKQKAYQAEVKAISQLRHDHLVQLIGWCQENEEFFIVYEFMANGNLETHLFDSNSSLDWKQRYGIALGLASALSYMHGEPNNDYVLHRDIKPNNILLDSNFNAKLSDFGLAKLVERGNPARTTKFLFGTERYVAPEYVETLRPSKKTDIYSFGIVALEIATGRAAVEGVRKIIFSNLLEMKNKNNNILDLADPKLGDNFDRDQMGRLMVVGLACAHREANRRPEMGEALKMLKGEIQLPDLWRSSIVRLFESVFHSLPHRAQHFLSVESRP